MMACWKQNDFNDAPCAEEIRTFYDCVAKAEVIKASFMFLKASSRKGGSLQSFFCVPVRIMFSEGFDYDPFEQLRAMKLVKDREAPARTG